MSKRSPHPSYRQAGKIYRADSCLPLVRAAAAGEVRLEAKLADPKAATAKIKALEGVRGVSSHQVDGWTRFAIETDGDPRERVYNLTVEEKWAVRELSRLEARIRSLAEAVALLDARTYRVQDQRPAADPPSPPAPED